MRKVKYETYKALSKFHIILLCFLFFSNILLYVFEYREMFSEKHRNIVSQQELLLDLKEKSPKQYNELYTEHLAKLSDYDAEYYKNLSSKNKKSLYIFENTYIDYDDYGDIQLFWDVESIINAPNDYNSKLSTLVNDAVSRLKESDSNSYINKYYMRLCESYLPLLSNELPIYLVKGWGEFFASQTSAIMITIATIFFFCETFTVDKRAGILNILSVSKNGRRQTCFAKLIFTLVSSSVITLSFSVSPLFIFSFSSGLSGLTQPIQLIKEFVYCPYEITIGQYLLFYLLIRIVVFALIATFVAFIGQMFDERFSIFVGAIVFVSGYFISQIAVSSPYYFLVKYSIFEISNVNVLFTKYRSFNLFGYCIDYSPFILALVLVSLTVILILSVLVSNKLSAEEYIVDGNNTSSATFTTSILGTEFYKEIVSNKMIYVIIVAFIAKMLLNIVYYHPTENYTETQYKAYINQVSGVIDNDKLEKITDEENYINFTLSEYDNMNKAYRAGEITYEEYQAYKSRYNYAEYCFPAMQKLVERRDYILSVRESYPDVEFIYDATVTDYLQSPLYIISAVAIICMGNNIFAREYSCGFSKIMRASKHGRKKIFISKLIYSLVISSILFVLLTLTDIIPITYYNDISYLAVPIQSVPLASDFKYSISIGEYLIFSWLIMYFGYVLSFMCTAAVSCIIKKQTPALTITSIIILTPFILNRFVVNVSGFAEMLSPMNLTENFLGFVCCTLAVVILILYAYCSWCEFLV